MAQSARPITIAGRSDIAKVVFSDGHSLNFPTKFPSIASITSISSIPTTPSTFRSRSTSQGRGRRDHGGSFSSTSSVRESFNLMSTIDDAATDPDSTLTTFACSSADCSRPPLSELDNLDTAEEWGSQTLRPQDFWNIDRMTSPSVKDQDHLVAGADGGSFSLPQHWEHMDGTFDDLVVGPSMDEAEESFMGDTNLATFAGPQSAPAASNWMSFARRGQETFSHAADEGAEKPSAIALAVANLPKASRKPGRARGSKLPEEKRQKVAKMRKIGACKYCKEGRRSCDPGTPCRPCIQHFGAAVLDAPNHCRKNIVSSLCDQILSKVCKWHPHPREMTDFFGRDFYVTDWRFDIPIQFGFGPHLRCSVLVVQTSEVSHLKHQHVTYASPLTIKPEPSHDYVLPVTFQDPTRLYSQIDKHLSTLVDEHFGQLTVFNSHLQILDKILKLYHHFRHTSDEYASLLHQALKFLVLVHSSEITIPNEDVAVTSILSSCAPGYTPDYRVTPCVLRAELGKVMPELAGIILEDVLGRLLRICLARRCDQHPVVVASFSVLMMAIESIMYHSSRIGYHANTSLPGLGANASIDSVVRGGTAIRHNPFESIAHPIEAAEAIRKLETAAWDLQTIYRNCFENCHALLLRIIEERHFTSLQKQFGDVPASFIAALNQAIREAGGYLEVRVSEKVDGLNDTSLLFDRLLARLFLLQTGPL